MKKTIVAIVALALIAPALAMPTKQQLAQAQPLVNDLTADDLRALKAKEKTPGDVAAAHLALADKADTEAGKYLLLQGAFRLYARSGDYDAAAATLQRMRGEIADLPPEVIVEIINNEMRRVASAKAPKVLAIFRDAQRMIKYRKQLAAAELDATAHPENVRYQRRVAECHACLGDWPKALEIFAKIGAEAAKFERDPASAAGCDAAKAADFWWNYKAEDPEPFKAHAAALYKKGLEDGSITGLRKTLAEKRVKEMECVTTASCAAPRGSGAPAASGGAPSNALYCVIDLSAGSTASKYPIKWLAVPPTGGFNTDEYKTRKLVLRRIEPGKFMMGGECEVTLTKPFYCGVFEVTQKQYELVTGSNPSQYKGDMRPVEKVSWNTVRGDSSAYDWPSSVNVDPNSFMGKIQARTGLNFDLPTDAQWEYACRAGTTSKYNNGGNAEDDLKQLGRFKNNQSDGKGGYSQHTTAGSYQPNAWGLYDMHGNVVEWCLDWKGSLSSGVRDPSGPSSGTHRVLRGGGYIYNKMDYFDSSCRLANSSSHEYSDIGFRLCMNPEAPVVVSTRGSGAPAASKGAAEAVKTKTIDLGGGVKMEMIYVAPGSFVMGRDDGNPNSKPAHRVTLTKGYWLGKYEVTQRQWQRVMGINPSHVKGDNLPVDSVSWNDCQAFIRKVNSMLGVNRVRLPTEAEWEYACCAGTTGAFGGTGQLDDMGWYKGNSDGKTHPVGQKQPNAWGFYDMHGNVREWCGDRWEAYPRGEVTDPTGPSMGNQWVSRGGGWNAPKEWCSSFQRWRESATFVKNTYGFRLCMTAMGDASKKAAGKK